MSEYILEDEGIGLAEKVLLGMITVLLLSVAFYYISGMGNPPEVQLQVEARDGSIYLKVISGEIPKSDWEYLIFDERVNPPVIWTPAPEDIKPGAEIQLKTGLQPATYRVQIRYKPTASFLVDSKIDVKG